MKTVKRLSVVLAVLLVVSLAVVAFVVNAADDVYTVSSEADFDALVDGLNNGTIPVNQKVAIKEDINLTDGNVMITKNFTGVIDGENHTISGINNTMFKELAGTVKNLVLEGMIDYSTADNRWTSTLALEAKTGGAVIENILCKVDLKAKSGNLNVAGVIGYAKYAITMRNVEYAGNCEVNWTSKDAGIAGVIGWINTAGSEVILDDCSFTGTVSVDVNSTGTLWVAGIVGHAGSNAAPAKVTNCVNNGTIKVKDYTNQDGLNVYVGGIVGKFNTSNTSSIENCVNNGKFVYPDFAAFGGMIGSLVGVSGNPITNCISFTDEGYLCGFGDPTITDCFMKDDIIAVGKPIEMDGVTYQRYNFGIMDTTTYKIVNVELIPSFAEGSIKNEDGKYVIDSDYYTAFVSERENATAGKKDYRFVVAADKDSFTAYSDVTFELSFTKGGTVVKTAVKSVRNDLDVYASATAAGETYVAADGTLLFGLVVTDVPDDAWDSVTVTLKNAASADVIAKCAVTVADLVK